jgi:hypothetical protein
VTTEPRKPTKRRRGGRRRTRRPAAPTPEPLALEALPVEDATPEPEPDPVPHNLPLAEPELAFAARAAARPPEPERPLPTTRRAIFFDVENTSRVQHIARVIDHLAVDRLGRRTDFIAVGNWRVIGHDTARLLAGHGAQLLHSAPSVGVKDWSDLRIAVAAGVWLGTARPGDMLEIISDDRAFDAVGDVATSLGVTFRRLSFRRLTGLATPAPVAPVDEPPPPPPSDSHGGRRRRGRRGGRRYERPPAPVMPAPRAPEPELEAHTAPHDELLGVARDLIHRSPNASTTLDALANALKSRGFSRPPGSPRLITRLRRLRELSVSRSGQITLVSGGEEAAAAPEATEQAPAPFVYERVEHDDQRYTPPERPPSRPGPADDERMTYEQRRAAVEAAQHGAESAQPGQAAEAPEADEEPVEAGAPAEGQRRRRSRRGGRRRRRHAAAG